jgi:hypothetical protein
MAEGEAMQAQVPRHEWGCRENHGTHPTHVVVWPDGREDEVPTCCYEQGNTIDPSLERFERVEWIPGLTITDDSLDATMTLHQVATDLYLLVFGASEERDGGLDLSQTYETVSIAALRGDRDAALRVWNARMADWIEEQEFDNVEHRECRLLAWAVEEGFNDRSHGTYRDYLADNPDVEEGDLLRTITELGLRGFLYATGGGLDEEPRPSTKADLCVGWINRNPTDLDFDLDESCRRLLDTALAAHGLSQVPNSDVIEDLALLDSHSREGCDCEPDAVQMRLSAARQDGLPLALIDAGHRLRVELVDQGDCHVEFTESAIRTQDRCWEMPDVWTSGIVASALTSPGDASVKRGEADVVASLLFGWKGYAHDEVGIDGEIWNGVFPGVELLDSYDVEGYSFDGDDSSPLTSGGGRVGMVRLAGRYWAYQYAWGDSAPDWRLLPSADPDEARAAYVEGYTLD